ncbi:MAG: 30S ribosomal protein S21 [Spirochaetota bacterium]|nr:30S ribosomal protein S21 [Spirochaetota bacterium]
MLLVEIREGETVESAIKRFKKEVEKDGILTAEKKHRFYEKPSETRKRKKAVVQRKIEKKVRKMKLMERYA